MTQSRIPILVDDRELSSGVFDLLDAHSEVTVTVQRLSLGDYQVDGTLLVERKTLMDLAHSIKQGRLFRQACRLAGSAQRSVIILEGRASDLASSGMRREALQGALITLTVYLGIPLLRSRDWNETVQLMIYAARQGRAIAADGLPRKGRRPKGKRRAQLHMLQGLPGVGPKRAAALLERFGSVESVLTARADDLAAVDGIGYATAEMVRWVIREPARESGYVLTGTPKKGSAPTSG